MDKDTARKLIAIVFSNKKNSERCTKQDFVTFLSFKRSLLKPDVVEKFIVEAVNEGLLYESDKEYTPAFSPAGIIVPLDFSVNVDELFSSSRDKPIVDRLLDAIAASGKLTKKEAIARSKEVTDKIKLINFDLALMAVMSDEDIDLRPFTKEMLETYLKLKN
ncbi:MAG: DUF2240 family protein [Thermoplasmataceae archaeon]